MCRFRLDSRVVSPILLTMSKAHCTDNTGTRSETGAAQQADVVFAGGGMVGMTLAVALAEQGLRCAVVDRDAPDAILEADYDGRTSAIAFGSARVLKTIGVWDDTLEAAASPIWDIRVADGHPMRGVSPLFLHYDHQEVGSDPFGWIIENRAFRAALYRRAKTLDTLDLIAPVAMEGIERDGIRATAQLADGRTIEAPLAIAADGKFSRTREAAGIKSTGWRYGQTSIVCTVKHERSHGGVAVELFLPGGPFAMLPMTDDRMSIVWSEQTDEAARLMVLQEDEFLAELRLRFGDWLGDLSLTGPRFSYPLSLSQAESYVGERLALIGDAAHAIHPIAGQGLNMGLRDVAAMAEVLVDAARIGMDIGSAPVLERYERWRRFDNVLLAAVTDGLTKVFSNDVAPLRLARDIGLAAVNRTPPARKFLMRHAMGVVGELPRLVRGEAL